jgi:ABC-type transport system substrate-binding protein
MEDRSNYWLRRRISRRTALRGSALGLTGAASLALVGCGDDDDDDGNGPGLINTPQATPTAAKQPKPGGSFSFQIGNPPPSLDPYTQTSFLCGYMNGLSLSKLYRFKAGTPDVAPADNAMELDLASALPEQPDQLTLNIKLKPNVKFHNGRALTSEDIRYAYDRYRTSRSRSTSPGSPGSTRSRPRREHGQAHHQVPYADAVFYLGATSGLISRRNTPRPRRPTPR